MEKYYKNKEDNTTISMKQKVRENALGVSLAGSIFLAGASAVSMVAFAVGTVVYTVAYGEGKTWEECNKCNMIVVNDGEIITFKEIDSPINPGTAQKKEFGKSWKVPSQNDWQSYEVSSMDADSCVIFVYGDNEKIRGDYTDFIIENITLNNDKTIGFNEDNLTDEKYEAYTKEKEEAPQRKRV